MEGRQGRRRATSCEGPVFWRVRYGFIEARCPLAPRGLPPPFRHLQRRPADQPPCVVVPPASSLQKILARYGSSATFVCLYQSRLTSLESPWPPLPPSSDTLISFIASVKNEARSGRSGLGRRRVCPRSGEEGRSVRVHDDDVDRDDLRDHLPGHHDLHPGWNDLYQHVYDGLHRDDRGSNYHCRHADEHRHRSKRNALSSLGGRSIRGREGPNG